jgi:hypothetical protein
VLSVTQPDPARTPTDDPVDDTGDRESITEIRGTVARFEMTYSPERGERVKFGPPLRVLVPGFLYLGLAVLAALLIFTAHAGAHGTSLYTFIVEGDRNRPIGSIAFAIVLVTSALATVLRAQMRGVIVHGDGLESRDIALLGVPRIRRFAWAQIDRLVVSETEVMLELWNGTYEKLPAVARPESLVMLLERIAIGRNIQLTRLTVPSAR